MRDDHEALALDSRSVRDLRTEPHASEEPPVHPSDEPFGSESAREISPRQAALGVALAAVFALGVPAFAEAGGKCASYRSCVPQDCKVASDMAPGAVAQCCKPPSPQLCAQAALSDLKGDVYGSRAAHDAVGSGWDVNMSTDAIVQKLFGEKSFQSKQSGILKACGLNAADFKDVPELQTDCHHMDVPYSVDIGPPTGKASFPKSASPTDFEDALKKGKRPDGCSLLSGVCAEQVTEAFRHEQEHYSRCGQSASLAAMAISTDNAAKKKLADFNLDDEADAYHHEARRHQHTIEKAKRSCELAKQNAAPPPSNAPSSGGSSTGPPPNGTPPNGTSSGGPPSSGAPPAGEPSGWPIGDPPSTSGTGPSSAGPKRWGNPFLTKALGDLALFHKVGAW